MSVPMHVSLCFFNTKCSKSDSSIIYLDQRFVKLFGSEPKMGHRCVWVGTWNKPVVPEPTLVCALEGSVNSTNLGADIKTFKNQILPVPDWAAGSRAPPAEAAVTHERGSGNWEWYSGVPPPPCLTRRRSTICRSVWTRWRERCGTWRSSPRSLCRRWKRRASTSSRSGRRSHASSSETSCRCSGQRGRWWARGAGGGGSISTFFGGGVAEQRGIR